MKRLSQWEIAGKANTLEGMLSYLHPSDRIEIVGQALYNMNKYNDKNGTEYHSCGNGEWDLTMDYREAEKR